ncbi:MAG: DUF309 domain-containing protein [Pyrinomonadaceae bacterium]
MYTGQSSGVSTPRIEDLYLRLISGVSGANGKRESPELSELIDPQAAAAPPLLLSSLDELHFLDWHACALLAGSQIAAPVLILERSAAAAAAAPHLRARVAAEFSDDSRDIAAAVPYQPGSVLSRSLSQLDWPQLWHGYLTSRDLRRTAPRRPALGATLISPFPHLRAGFLTGIDLFHAGEYYAAHEDLEALWMRLDDGLERRSAQGLIQLSGAHLHRVKGRVAQAQALYRRARAHLRAAAHAVEWLATDELIASSDAAFTTANPTELLPWPFIPLINPAPMRS